LPYEIHPDTPPDGVRLDEYFSGLNPDLFFEELNQRGHRYGIHFGPQQVMSNSRLALMGGEFAKEHGCYHQYHHAVFKAFFTDCLNIGRMEVLLEIARECNLDPFAFEKALTESAYMDKLQATNNQARDSWVNVAPTFVISGHGNVDGAASIDSFRKIFRKITQG
jgi:predicted DsbA family dithiol-disulfide isomerase